MLWGSPYVCEGRLNIDTSHSPINLILHIAPSSPSLSLSLTTHKKFMSWRERGMKSKSTKVTAPKKKKTPPLNIAQFLFTSVNHIMIFFLSFSPPPQKKTFFSGGLSPYVLSIVHIYVQYIKSKSKGRKEGAPTNQEKNLFEGDVNSKGSLA